MVYAKASAAAAPLRLRWAVLPSGSRNHRESAPAPEPRMADGRWEMNHASLQMILSHIHLFTCTPGLALGGKEYEVHAAQAKDLANFEDHLLSHLWEVEPRLRRSGGKNG